MSNCSAIVVGGGHNGLVAANYLARAGLRVLILERRDFVGGACITEELFPGFRISSCSYICHLLQEKVIDDLELKKYGLKIYPLDPIRFQPLPGNQRVLTWHDDHKTSAEIRAISPQDAERYPDWILFWQRAAGILHRYFLTDPPTLAEVAAELQGTPDEFVFERMLTGNVRDLVIEYFESPLVRAVFADAQDAGDIRAPGSIMALAYIRCNQFTSPQNLGIPHGGMGAITQAMARSAEAHGVEIRTGIEVKQIVIRDDRATGVLLQNGQEISADVLLSDADPKRTFLNLIDPKTLIPDLAQSVRRLKTDVSYLKFHCALNELPDFSAYLGEDFKPEYLAYMRICPSMEYFEQSWEDAKNGRPSKSPVLLIQIPSVCDSSLTPPGKHVMSVWVMYAPVRLQEDSWDTARQPVGEHLIDTIQKYAPNFRKAIIDWELFTPLDLNRRVFLTDGNIRHLNITSHQLLANRPNRELSGYKTPIEGLYLCGAGTHPGGEVTGAPGHNAAHAVLRDWKTAVR